MSTTDYAWAMGREDARDGFAYNPEYWGFLGEETPLLVYKYAVAYEYHDGKDADEARDFIRRYERDHAPLADRPLKYEEDGDVLFSA